MELWHVGPSRPEGVTKNRPDRDADRHREAGFDRMIAGFTSGERDYIRCERGRFLLDIAERGRGLSSQDLAWRPRGRQVEAADGEGVGRAWPHAA
jgi:hypothetical protein